MDEMIEAYLAMEGDPMTPEDWAAELADNACAQGMINAEDDAEINNFIWIATARFRELKPHRKIL